MPSLSVSICVFTVLLSYHQICQCRPNTRSRRELAKDIPFTDKVESAEDGLIPEIERRSDSEVTDTSVENAEGKYTVSPDPKNSDVELIKEIPEKIQTGNTEKEQLKKETADKVQSDTVPSLTVEEKAETANDPKAAAIAEDAAEKSEIIAEKTAVTPPDTKLLAPPKPDSKDEIALKTSLPPVDIDEKTEDKISIGQFPGFYPQLVPEPGSFRVPVLIPIRHISFKTVRVIPVPPADVSDRLPLPYEDDIVGEGAHESESEEVLQPLAEKKEDGGYQLGNPLNPGIPLPMLSFNSFLKDLKDIIATTASNKYNTAAPDTENAMKNNEKQSKVVDVLGQKFLMQSNAMKFPTKDNGHTFFRFLSMKPLDEVKPTEPKEGAAGEMSPKGIEIDQQKDKIEPEIKKEETMVKDEMVKEKSIIESEIKKKADEEIVKEVEMKKEKDEESEKEAEILKAEETQIKMKVEQDVPKGIIVKNMNKPEMEEKIEAPIKKMKGDEGMLDEADMPQFFMKDEDKIVTAFVEKTETQEAEENDESEEKDDDSEGDEDVEDDEMEMHLKKNEKSNEKKMTAQDAIAVKKEMEMGTKKDFYLSEKKKKEKSMEESEEMKPKKKMQKKKKCKCEEKDSDSEDDE